MVRFLVFHTPFAPPVEGAAGGEGVWWMISTSETTGPLPNRDRDEGTERALIIRSG